jgi:SAM-dependent methyltransferase
MIGIISVAGVILLLTQSPRFGIDRAAYDDFVSRHFAGVFPKFALEISDEYNVDTGRILEIAFTAPYLSLELADISSANFEILVADSTEAKICSSRIEDRGLSGRFTIHIGEANSLPFEDTTFALVITREAMRFWQSDEKAYREINRVMKKGGAALLGAGFGTAVHEDEAQRMWSVVQQWRMDNGCEPWAATRPIPDDIEKTLVSAGIFDYSMVVEGDCTCRTMVQWQKPDANRKPR